VCELCKIRVCFRYESCMILVWVVCDSCVLRVRRSCLTTHLLFVCHLSENSLWLGCDSCMIRVWFGCDWWVSFVWFLCESCVCRVWCVCVCVWFECVLRVNRVWLVCDSSVIRAWSGCDTYIIRAWRVSDSCVICLRLVWDLRDLCVIRVWFLCYLIHVCLVLYWCVICVWIVCDSFEISMWFRCDSYVIRVISMLLVCESCVYCTRVCRSIHNTIFTVPTFTVERKQKSLRCIGYIQPSFHLELRHNMPKYSVTINWIYADCIFSSCPVYFVQIPKFELLLFRNAIHVTVTYVTHP